MAIKDYNDVAGQLTTNGSPIYAEYRAPADDRTVAVLRGNGAIPLAKSNVPELAAVTLSIPYGKSLATPGIWSTPRGVFRVVPPLRLRQARSGSPTVPASADRCGCHPC